LHAWQAASERGDENAKQPSFILGGLQNAMLAQQAVGRLCWPRRKAATTTPGPGFIAAEEITSPPRVLRTQPSSGLSFLPFFFFSCFFPLHHGSEKINSMIFHADMFRARHTCTPPPVRHIHGALSSFPSLPSGFPFASSVWGAAASLGRFRFSCDSGSRVRQGVVSKTGVFGRLHDGLERQPRLSGEPSSGETPQCWCGFCLRVSRPGPTAPDVVA